MPRDLSIADRCRAAGLRVVECAGWQTRGSTSFNGRGSVNHHTAGSSRGSAPSLNGVIHGHTGSAPGPLCHCLQSREPDGNDIFYVVAAGTANHAGKGGWKGLSGNSTVYGLEIEHTGVEPLPQHRQQLAARWHAAMANGRFGAPMTCQHKEWAPSRKIDAATHVDPTVFRAWVADWIGGVPPSKPPPTEPVAPATYEEDTMIYIVKENDGRKTFRALNSDNELRFVDEETFALLYFQGHKLANKDVNHEGMPVMQCVQSTIVALGSKGIPEGG